MNSRTTKLRVTAKTLGALALLQAALPFNAALTAVALLSGRDEPARPSGRTVLVSGDSAGRPVPLPESMHAAAERWPARPH